jgi:hypothetical protein
MTILDDRLGTNTLAFVCKRALVAREPGRFPSDEVDGVGGGELTVRLFVCECEWEVDGWCGGVWIVLGIVWDRIGVLGPWRGGGCVRGDIGIPAWG